MKKSKTTKVYCIDTSVFIDNPDILNEIKGQEIIIPFCVLHELDNNRKKIGLLAKNARKAIKSIDEFIKENNKKVRFLSSDFNLPTNDLKIIACAQWIQSQENKKVCILSNDIGLRVQAHTQKIYAEGRYSTKNNIGIYKGYDSINIKQEYIEELYSRQNLVISKKDFTTSDGNAYLNQMFILNSDYTNSTAITRITHIDEDNIYLSKIEKRNMWNLSPVNVEQVFATEILLEPEIELVSLVGRAGSGKTLLSIAGALEQTIENGLYDKIILIRPIVTVGNDIGYLPGSAMDKIEPWIQPFKDNLDVLFKGDKRNIQNLFDSEILKIEIMSYIRGRSLPKSFIIIDECQNISPDDIKTLLTRSAKGSKIVITGDIDQIDSKHLDSYNNGLSIVIEKFKNIDLYGHVVLNKSQRSRLAELATEIL